MKNVFLILLMMSSLLFGVQRKVRIADIENKPLSNVVLKIEDRAFLTNETGIASITAGSEADTVFIHKIGYEDISYIWKELPSNLKLRTKSVELPGFTVTSQKNSSNPTLKKIVIKNDEELANAETAADLLSNHGEIRILGSDIAGAEKSVSLLGHQSKHTLVLLDGIPLNSSGQKFDISTIPAKIIESIEVIPQNATATTGAGAIGGAINIITKNETVSESSLSSGISYAAGSFGKKATNSNLNFLHPKFALDLNYSWQEADNDFEYEYFLANDPETRERENNQYSDNVLNLNFKLNHPINLKYNLIKQHFEKGLPGPINLLANYDKAVLTGDLHKHSASINRNYKQILFKLQGFWFDEETEFDNLNSTMMPSRQRGENETFKRGAELQTSYQLENINLMLELEHRREGFKYTHYNRYDAYMDHKSIDDVFQENNAAAFSWVVDKKIDMTKISFQSTMRVDKVIKSGSNELENSWQGELLFDFVSEFFPEVSFRYGTSFALPSFYDLYWVGDSQAQGNPDLKPEYAEGGGVELAYDFFWGSFNAGVMQNRIENLIYWSRGTMGWKPHNLDKAEITNYKIEGSIKPFEFIEIGGSWLRTFALNKSKIEPDGGNFDKSVVNTPRSITSLYKRTTFKDFNLEWSYNRTGLQYTMPNESRPLKAYFTMDLKTGYGFDVKGINWELTGKINNITDEVYNVYSDNPMPGRTWQAGVSMEYVYK